MKSPYYGRTEYQCKAECSTGRHILVDALLFLSLLALGGFLLSGCAFLATLPIPPAPPPVVAPPPLPEELPAPPAEEPAEEPAPPPPVDPPAPPPVETPTVIWAESTDADLCPVAHVEGRADLSLGPTGAPRPEFIADVESITLAHPPLPGDDERSWYSRLVAPFAARGLSIAMYGEELAVARTSGVSENYDRLLASGKQRAGIGTFQSRCFPATRSAPLVAPVAAPGAAWEYPVPVVQIRLKVHTSADQRADGRAVMDAVALGSGVNPAFPGRSTWPACGPEGETDGERERRVACDRGMDPRWEARGRANENPWLYHADKGTDVRVCVRDVCSNVVRAQ